MPAGAAQVLAKRAASLIYGTAGKADRTAPLVSQAIQAGFRAIDTAAQPRSYAEDLVGAGVRDALTTPSLARQDLWIQSKFTPAHDQDESIAPYKATDSIADQVKASIAQSLQHLNVDGQPYIDAVLLHSPYKEASTTLEAWQALSRHTPEQVRTLGISNISMEQLDELLKGADVKPSIVQNAFTAETGYDLRLRAYCRDKDISYEAYGVLSGNEHILQSTTVQDLARTIGIPPEATLYALIVLGLNVSVLTGTSNLAHMRADLDAISKVRAWRNDNRNRWMNILSSFKGSLSRGRIL